MLDAASDFARELADRRRAFQAKIARNAVRPERALVTIQPHEPIVEPSSPVRQPAVDLSAIAARSLRQAESDIDAKREATPPRAEILTMIADGLEHRPTIDSIQRSVAEHYNVRRSDIMNSRRYVNVVRPRQIAMYLSRVLTLRSLLEIGRRFGGRDHTTVLHAVRKIEAMIAADPCFAARVEWIKADVVERMIAAQENAGADHVE